MRIRSSVTSDVTSREEMSSGDKSRMTGAALVQMGAMDQPLVEQVLKMESESGRPFSEIVLEQGFADPHCVQEALASVGDDTQVTLDESSVDGRVLIAHDPQSPLAEQLQSFLLSLEQVIGSRPGEPAIFTVSGTDVPSDTAILAANMAVASAHAGHRTLLIDANFEHPIHNSLFAVHNRVGLIDLLASKDLPDRYIQYTAVPRLMVMPTGPFRQDCFALLEREQLVHRILPIIDKFDVIFIECSSLLPPMIARASVNADSAIIAVKQNHSSARELQQLVSLLDRAGVSQPGVILLE